MKIIFFTEAGTNIGYGHITRCYSLIQAFQKIGFSTQLVVNTDIDINPIVPEAKPVVLNWIDKKDECNSLVKQAQIAIFDSYLAPPTYLLQLAKSVKTPVFIDDFLRMDYSEGIVFNGAVKAENLPYPQNDKIKYLLGLNYQPVRSAFWQMPKHVIKRRIDSIFITVGGNDIHNILPKLVELAAKNYPSASCEIVCGNNPKMKNWVENQRNNQIRAHFNLSAKEMRNLMQKCDFAISAAGQTLYELAAAGLPCIAFSVADNQATNLKGWTDVGFSLNAGICTDDNFYPDLDSCLKKISKQSIRNNASFRGQILVNEQGGINTVKEILKFHFQKNLIFELAQESDVDDVYNLSNDDTVRANSFNTQKIEYTEHVNWYIKKIKDPESLFLIAKIEDSFAGQVRYQIEKNNAVIGISIAKTFRGYGLGETMLIKSAAILKSKHPKIKKIIAHVKEENIASAKMFLKAGYVLAHNPEHLQFELPL